MLAVKNLIDLTWIEKLTDRFHLGVLAVDPNNGKHVKPQEMYNTTRTPTRKYVCDIKTFSEDRCSSAKEEHKILYEVKIMTLLN